MSQETISVPYSWGYNSCYEGMDASYYALQNENARLTEEIKELKEAKIHSPFKVGDKVWLAFMQISFYEPSPRTPLYPLPVIYRGRLAEKPLALVETDNYLYLVPLGYLCVSKKEWMQRYKNKEFSVEAVTHYYVYKGTQ